MAYSRNVIVEQARAWLGCNEKDGSFKKIIDTYNSHKPLARGYDLKYTDEWCSGFVSAVSIACGYTAILPTEVGCGKHIALFQQLGSWVEADDYVPSPGDVLFYDWSDNGKGENTDGASHVGIVEKVEGSTMYIIEGNSGEAVKRCTVQINGRYIRGFGVPKYDDAAPAEPVQVNDVLAGDVVEITGNKWYSGSGIPDWVKAKRWIVFQVSGNRAVLNDSEDGREHNLCSPIHTDDIKVVKRNGKPVQPAPAPAPAEKPVSVTLTQLVKGSKGEEVKTMQRLLYVLGFSLGNNGVDGDLGDDTVAAIKAFQTKEGLAADGVCGVDTWNALLK